ncbi:tetratricopeptide repeat protein [Paraburkholderia bonniea]|uniref:tetratricopeptide repeat protein n=1 Tax=Paraburkholderia bonniea TaxID=2152891 RepID=UPI001290D504|nr:tetratricopeptide repeat protein [Paraburkholderia bonniea]
MTTAQELPSLLQQALAQHQAGQLEVAQQLYQQLLQANPADPDALHFLGLLTCQTGEAGLGIALMRRSIVACPNAVYYNNLGNALRDHGELLKAIDSYRQAVTLQPDYPEAHNNLGNALREAHQPHDALKSCTHALTLRPGYAQAYNNLGNALKDLGDLDAAAQAYRQALASWPDYADAHHNLGNVLLALDLPDAAIESYRCATVLNPASAQMHNSLGTTLVARGQLAAAIETLTRALQLDPDDAHTHNNLGSALRDVGQIEAAVAAFEQAIALSPDFAEAYSNLASVLRRQEKFAAAIAAGRKALELNPSLVDAYNTLGNAYVGLEEFSAALEIYHQALALDPEHADVHHNLAIVLLKSERAEEALESAHIALTRKDGMAQGHVNLGDILRCLGDLDGAISSYRHALERDPDVDSTHTSLLFCQATRATATPQAYLADARRFGELVAQRARPWPHTLPDHEPELRPLRIGFVSGDLRRHPVGIFLESVLAAMNPAQVTLIAYATVSNEDSLTQRLKCHFAAWHTLSGMSDEAASRKIYEDRIDVLVDLSGHTSSNRLGVFAWRPAPVQLSWLGFFASTGVAAMDYMLGDIHVLPENEASHFVEKPWRLPCSYLCFTPPDDLLEVSAAPLLHNGYVTYGCFGKLSKVTDDVIAVWSRVLHAVPDSRLLLKAHELSSASAQRKMQVRFAAHGIEADRLLLEQGAPRSEYLAAYHRVDVMLSPFPYPGGTTTAEGLWMGVPVLALKGERFVTHICESVLHGAGQAAWIAQDREAYVAKAAAVASVAGREALVSLRAALRHQVLSSPLCDAPRFARHLEQAFHDMWAQYMNQSRVNA